MENHAGFMSSTEGQTDKEKNHVSMHLNDRYGFAEHPAVLAAPKVYAFLLPGLEVQYCTAAARGLSRHICCR